jgi:hypothetical protein
MPKDNKIEQQRQIVRAFRQAGRQRTQAEAEAATQRDKIVKEANDLLAQEEKRVKNTLDKAWADGRAAHTALGSLGAQNTELESLLRSSSHTSTPVQPPAGSRDPSGEFGQLAQAALRYAARIKDAPESHQQASQRDEELKKLSQARVLLWLSVILGLPMLIVAAPVLAFTESEASILLLYASFSSPVFLAWADGIWNMGDKQSGHGFNRDYLWGLLIAPLMSFAGIYHLVDSYPKGKEAIAARYPKAQSRETLLPQVNTVAADLVKALREARMWGVLWVDRTRQTQQTALDRAEAEYRHDMAQAQSGYEQSWTRIKQATETLFQDTGTLVAPWSLRSLWDRWEPPTQGDAASYVRLGRLTESGTWNRFSMPALVPVLGGSNVVIRAPGSARNQAVHVVRTLMLRLLAAVPPGKLRFILLDPVGLGQSVATFMRLADDDESLVGSRAWTEPRQIEEQLARLTEHMELVIQKFLRDRYATIEDYNAEAGEVAEPYRVLVAVNFPVNFSEEAARRLVSIALNGPRCGVYTILTVDTDQRLPYGFAQELAHGSKAGESQGQFGTTASTQEQDNDEDEDADDDDDEWVEDDDE